MSLSKRVNSPWSFDHRRAVIGGLIFATVATLFFVSAVSVRPLKEVA